MAKNPALAQIRTTIGELVIKWTLLQHALEEIGSCELLLITILMKCPRRFPLQQALMFNDSPSRCRYKNLEEGDDAFSKGAESNGCYGDLNLCN